MRRSRAVFSLVAVLLSGCVAESTNNEPSPADGCPELGEASDHSGTISTDETWGAGLHTVSYHVQIDTGATLTIEPCAVVRLGPDITIEVDGEGASLVAIGTEEKPIVFEPDAGQPWGSVAVFAPATVRLEHVTLRRGGTTTEPRMANYAGATVVARNQTETAADSIFVRQVAVEDSSGLGVFLQGGGFAEGSDELTVTGSGLNPVYLGAGYATNLPPGEYAGNGDDQFLLQSVGAAVYDNTKPVLRDATLPNRGLPYLVGIEGTAPSIWVGDGREESPAATLTIEPGVELRFQGRESTATQLLVRGKPSGVPQGTLVAQGSADRPIVFTSAEDDPLPGDWQGLYFQYVVSPATSIDHARVEYAGGESTTTGLCIAAPGASNFDADCSVVMFLDEPPEQQFITNSTFEDGLGCGIYRGWTGEAVDFAASNTFTNLTGCNQSDAHDADSGCLGSCK